LAFNRLDDLPEILLQGRERELLTWLFRAKSTRPWTITPADLGEYVRVNAAPGATRAALSYQRHNLGPEGIAHTRARAERKLAMPVLAVGAESGGGAMLLDTMRLVAADVRSAVFVGCGHYMPGKYRAVAEQIIGFMGRWRGRKPAGERLVRSTRRTRRCCYASRLKPIRELSAAAAQRLRHRARKAYTCGCIVAVCGITRPAAVFRMALF
jgi:hypothetical protein